MKIAIFGGTGFVGSYLVDELIKNGHYISLFVRKKNLTKTINKSFYVDIINGNTENNKDIENTIKNCDIVIYAIGIIRSFKSEGITFENTHFEIAKKCIDISVTLKVKRFIMISAYGVKIEGTDYQRTKFLGEQYLKKSGLKYTIFQPSVIFGKPKYDSHKEFTTVLKKNIIDLPLFAPSFFTGFKFYKAGHYHLSPIHVGDVSKAITYSLHKNECENKTYTMCGSSLTWNEIIIIIASANNKKKIFIPIPVLIVKLFAIIFNKFHFFPISKDEIKMLIEDNICKSTPDKDIFKILDISKKVFGISTV